MRKEYLFSEVMVWLEEEEFRTARHHCLLVKFHRRDEPDAGL